MTSQARPDLPDAPAPSTDDDDAAVRENQGLAIVSQVAGGILHDFNNILTVITGTIDILSQAVEDRPELAAVARLIDEAATRGARLTAQLLAFARGRPPRPCEVDLDELLTDVARLLRPTLGTQFEITIVVAPDTPKAFADPGQLMAALLCLSTSLRNVLPDGGAISFAAHRARAADDDLAVVIALRASGVAVPGAAPWPQCAGADVAMVEAFVRRSNGRLKLDEPGGAQAAVDVLLPAAPPPTHS